MSNSRPTHVPFMVVLSSPSGAGKTSICHACLDADRQLAYSISVTTRPPRKGERNGVSYHFVTPGRFRQLVRRRSLLEHARVYGHEYGTPRAPVLAHFRAGRDVIADLDPQGMRSCKRALPSTIGIFITVTDRRELARRLHRRGTDSPAELLCRQRELRAELAAIPDFDYLVVNDSLDRAVADVLTIIRAERMRVARRRPSDLSRLSAGRRDHRI
uniref:Guanylate kinase n=1 Tax=candidate division WOR-3 bacterium TaxID=2052148 RepID=A0A7C4G984_UNCW3